MPRIAAVEKEKIKMDDRRHVERVLSVLETGRCGIFNASDRVPQRVIFRYEGGDLGGGYSLVTDFANEKASRRILTWLRANADPDAFGCGLGHT